MCSFRVSTWKFLLPKILAAHCFNSLLDKSFGSCIISLRDRRWSIHNLLCVYIYIYMFIYICICYLGFLLIFIFIFLYFLFIFYFLFLVTALFPSRIKELKSPLRWLFSPYFSYPSSYRSFLFNLTAACFTSLGAVWFIVCRCRLDIFNLDSFSSECNLMCVEKQRQTHMSTPTKANTNLRGKTLRNHR